jgi:methionyl-tRNA formyltransferase
LTAVRIVFFAAGGPFAVTALQAIAAEHDIAGVVRPRDALPLWKKPARSLARLARLRHRDDVGEWTHDRGIVAVQAGREDVEALAGWLDRIAPDLICIATFPCLLPDAILTIPRYGVLNLHPSLLPRHRGPNPLFWTYYCDDTHGGVTVHVATRLADAGPMLGQEAIAIPRGWPSSELYLAASRSGAALLRDAVSQLERGTARPREQDDRLGTKAPRVRLGTPMVPYTEWDVERVWHFLAGLHPWYAEPVRSPEGTLVRYGNVIGFERCTPGGTPGTADPAPFGWQLWCRDGYVRLGRRRRLPQRVPAAS